MVQLGKRTKMEKDIPFNQVTGDMDDCLQIAVDSFYLTIFIYIKILTTKFSLWFLFPGILSSLIILNDV